MSAATGPSAIAVIGLSCRFPGARSVDEFWDNLAAGRESLDELSEQELLASGVSSELSGRREYVRVASRLRDIDRFDAPFFGMTPREAMVTDPQHRLFLECAWEAFEMAGYDPARPGGSAGVFAGAGPSSYLLSNIIRNREILEQVGELEIELGNECDYLPMRVSYKLDLRGPSVGVQTACSTSLVAVHQACESLLAGECDVALAGGATIRLPQDRGYLHEDGSVLSADGHCRAFDAKGSGTVFGSGVGVVLLKRLDDALRDRDFIHAVVLGSAVNNDGAFKVGFTAPGVEGQSRVIAEALEVAGVSPEAVSYVEAHGTATRLGDAVEFEALSKAFGERSGESAPCAIGSVKTNIGHTVAASGIAGLIKTVLALRHRQIPPSLHFESPNPHTDFAGGRFRVNTQLREWPDGEAARRAGVSSFGMGGTNCHVVLEEAPKASATEDDRPYELLVLSARDAPALEEASVALADHLDERTGTALGDVAFTLQSGRRAFTERRAVVCADRSEAVTRLRERAPGDDLRGSAGEKPTIGFVFPGQGAQFPGMAEGMYRSIPRFRDELDACIELSADSLGIDLRPVLFPPAGAAEAAADRLGQTSITQPALFCLEYALAKTLIAWAIQPAMMLGHSIGEYVAACLAGVFTVEACLPLVIERGRLMQAAPPGAMLAVALPEAEVGPLLDDDLTIAVVNSPSSCVISGGFESIERLAQRLKESEVGCTRLRTSHAFHSPRMDGVREALARAVRNADPRPPVVPYVSNVTGDWIAADEAIDPSYWAAQACEPVRFGDGVRRLLETDALLMLEVGPGSTLASLARESGLLGDGHRIAATVGHRRHRRSSLEHLLHAVGHAWIAGVDVEWESFHADRGARRVPLPTYRFQRQRFWVEPDEAGPTAKAAESAAELERWLHAPTWVSRPLGSPGDECEGKEARTSFVLLAPEHGIGPAMSAELERLGHEVVRVSPGSGLRATSERSFELDPEDPAGYRELIDRLAGPDGRPRRFVFAWSLDHRARGLAAAMESGYVPLTLLLQALTPASDGSADVVVIGAGAVMVNGDDSSEPERATVLGPVLAAPRECPGLTVRYVDIASPTDQASTERLAEQLVREVVADAEESVCAYRGDRRWVREYVPLRSDRSGNGGSAEAANVRPDGVWLITGGLGDLGLEVAEALAGPDGPKIVLTRRSPFPDRALWDEWLRRPEPTDYARRIERIHRIEELGSEVEVVTADVANEERMREALDRARRRFGPFTHVIHASGAFARVPIEDLDPEVAAASPVLAAKVTGLRTIEALTVDDPVELVVLFSSLATVLGSWGLSEYTAANAFLDAYAEAGRPDERPRTLAINWPAWEGLGMAAEEPGSTASPTALERDAAVAIFRRCLTIERPRVVVSRQPLTADAVSHRRFASTASGLDIDTDAQTSTTRQPSAATRPRPDRPRTETERIVAEAWQQVTGIDDLGNDANFFDVGADSLAAVRVTAQLNRRLSTNVSVDLLFRHQTIEEFSRAIEAARSE